MEMCSSQDWSGRDKRLYRGTLLDEDGMDAQQFVDALRVVVRDGVVSEVLSTLQRPPGRRPSEDLAMRSEWYNSLSNEKKRILSSIVLGTVDRAVFGVLCVLDGVRAIENGSEKGILELRYVKNGSVVLNPVEGEMLHDFW
jgi:hypothetical protein